ncbi:MAG: hypothetical protein RIR70_1655, partial [Pseudomonadota bacterium]
MDGLSKPEGNGQTQTNTPVDDTVSPPAANDPPLFVRIEPATPPGPGAVLRAERESRGYSIDDVAVALKLAPRQVEAIEADDFDALRGQTFARGFVKNYARLFGLDPEPLVARIKSSAPPLRVALEPRSNTRTDLPIAGGSQGPVVAGGLAVVALIVVAVVGTSAQWLGGDSSTRKGAAGEGSGVALSQTSGLSTPPQSSPLVSPLSPSTTAAAGAASAANTSTSAPIASSTSTSAPGPTSAGSPAVVASAVTTANASTNPVAAPATSAPQASAPAAQPTPIAPVSTNAAASTAAKAAATSATPNA